MADQKVTQLTANTDPQGTDIVYMVDDPGGTPASRKLTIANLMTKAPFALTCSSVGNTPADATTYYFSSLYGNAFGVSAPSQRLYIPRAGTITKAYIHMIFSAGTAETSTMSIRLNNTTDTTIVSTVNCSSSPYDASNTSLSIAVAAGDYVAIKWVTPTWATNPTALSVSVLLWIE